MAEMSHLDFILIRYVPSVVRGEFITIGVILFDPVSLAQGFCDACFITDWQRIESFDPDADLDMLQAIASDIQGRVRSPTHRVRFLEMMEDSFSNSIQLSPRSRCITEDPMSAIEVLARLCL
jgi:hypothetical protein